MGKFRADFKNNVTQLLCPYCLHCTGTLRLTLLYSSMLAAFGRIVDTAFFTVLGCVSKNRKNYFC